MRKLTKHEFADAVRERRTNDKMFDITSVLEKTIVGLKARPDFQLELVELYEPVGKLVRPLRREDIAERNGEHGKPFWITLGRDVLDITGTQEPKNIACSPCTALIADWTNI